MKALKILGLSLLTIVGIGYVAWTTDCITREAGPFVGITFAAANGSLVGQAIGGLLYRSFAGRKPCQL